MSLLENVGDDVADEVAQCYLHFGRDGAKSLTECQFDRVQRCRVESAFSQPLSKEIAVDIEQS